MVADRARFWMMQDHTVEQVREIYTWLDEQPTHQVWRVRRGADAVTLFQDSLGFEMGPVVQLSVKPAQLAFLTREQYAAARPSA